MIPEKSATGFAPSVRHARVMELAGRAPKLCPPRDPARPCAARRPDARSVGAEIMPHPIWGRGDEQAARRARMRFMRRH